jgi:hypothetical protein
MADLGAPRDTWTPWVLWAPWLNVEANVGRAAGAPWAPWVRLGERDWVDVEANVRETAGAL